MTSKRSYGDGCGVASALDLVGQRWALLVVRELLFGPKRFVDLRAGLPHASPNVLSQRLRELEAGGVLTRRKLPPPAGARVYELTEWGRQLEGALISLGRWAARSPSPVRGDPIGTDAVMLGLRVHFDSSAAEGLNLTYQLCLGADRFAVRVAGGRLEVTRDGTEHPDAVVTTDPETLRAILWHGRSLGHAQSADEVKVEGNREAVERLIQLVSMPEPAEPSPEGMVVGSSSSALPIG